MVKRLSILYIFLLRSGAIPKVQPRLGGLDGGARARGGADPEGAAVHGKAGRVGGRPGALRLAWLRPRFILTPS